MTLDEWIALTPDERNIKRKKWGCADSVEPSEEAWELLQEACNRFSEKYCPHPLINKVSPAGDRISVTTALYPCQIIEELPSRFCAFPVEQFAINLNRDSYLKSWNILFAGLLGWSETQTKQWAQEWDDDLNGRDNSMFYCEDDYYYALPEIVKVSGGELPSRPYELLNDLKEAIELNASSPIWLSPVDWEGVRTRVNKILQTVGGRLPIK